MCVSVCSLIICSNIYVVKTVVFRGLHYLGCRHFQNFDATRNYENKCSVRKGFQKHHSEAHIIDITKTYQLRKPAYPNILKISLPKTESFQVKKSDIFHLFVCAEVLRPSQPNGVMSSAVSLPNHTFTGQA